MTPATVNPSRESALKALSAGYQAAMRGKTIADNPYKSESMRSAWIQGFRAYEERMEMIKK